MPYDAVIIGSGPNGLAAGVHLARQGWKTLILEGAPTIGGGTRTKELTLPGFRHDVCSAVHPMGLASPFFQTLNLEAHGLRWIQPDIPLAHPLEGDHAAALYPTVAETAAHLGRDGWRYHWLFDTLVKHAAALFPDMLAPASLPRHPFLMARFGMGALLPASLLARYFKSEEARALFAGNAAHSILPLERPFTSAIGLALQVCAHAYGWPAPEGGSQAIADALASVFRAAGGEIAVGQTVRSLADLPDASAYLFDVSPLNLARIGGEALPVRYRRKLEAFRHGPGVFKVDYALSQPIPWRNEACRRAGTVHVAGTLAEVCAAERAPWENLLDDRPFVLVAQPSLSDPTRAPAGKHVAWAYCHVPHGCTADRLEVINAQIERFAPGFRDCVLATHTLNCAEMEAYNPNYLGGDVIGGVTDWRQLYTRPVGLFHPYATPNPKLFICSASTPPGGGVHGMCGYWAAQCVLQRVR